MTSSPKSIVLTGSLSGTVKPDLCANCGSPASESLLVEKVFEDSDATPRYTMLRVKVPFCAACIALHRGEMKPANPLGQFLLRFRSGTALGGAFSGAFGLWLLPKVLPRILRGDLTELLVFGAVLGFFFLIAYACFRAAWGETEHLTVRPVSTVTSAFDFSDDCSDTFEPERHIYNLRNERFAEAMLEANHGRVWNPASRSAKRAEKKRHLLLIAFAVVLGLFAIWDIVQELLD